MSNSMNPTTTSITEIAGRLRELFPGVPSVHIRVSGFGPSIELHGVQGEHAARALVQQLGGIPTHPKFGGFGRDNGRPWYWYTTEVQSLSITVHYEGGES